MIQIKYLFHSGFLVVTPDHFFLFDYFEDNCPKAQLPCGRLQSQDLPDDRPGIIFVSHGHYDHFDKKIFTFQRPDVEYVLSDDIPPSQLPQISGLHAVKPGNHLELQGVQIEVYGSTDAGCSFKVSTPQATFFHAGDLNWWHWTGESVAEQAYAKEFFFSELSKIPKQPIDFFFGAVDPRQEKDYFLGAEQFIKVLHPKVFIPMHFQGCFDLTRRLKAKLQEKYPHTRILQIAQRSQRIWPEEETSSLPGKPSD